MKKFLLLSLYSLFFFSKAQTLNTIPTQEYRASAEKTNNLVHTKLKIRFDFSKQELHGEEWITLQPHFYPRETVKINAKAMQIHQVMLVGNQNLSPLKYNYDGESLKIHLNKKYSKDEKYNLYISYTARPEKAVQKSSNTIKEAKGMYFINPLGEDLKKPTQIWTQGETESNSIWFPTIDKPNQKTTQEIYIIVPDRFVTLSNGLLVEQTKNEDGSRTDYWKLDLPHAPYLAFIGVGEYEVIKDQWENIPLHYYVEKEYAPYAKDIFGCTPEMMSFFSRITGVKYPWLKYDQIVVRDFVSGAMENTTAVCHGERAYQSAGELADGNIWEDTIAHELFHHWFGNLVTAESWSNITVNESFANYSPYLWKEYKYGKDHAEAYNYKNVIHYLRSGAYDKNLVCFHYHQREDVFNEISYSKGGLILHMLRKYVGDEGFFAGMKKYLTENKFGTAEAHQWRIALESVTGKDLNQFFNQWYYGSGHPQLELNHIYDNQKKKILVKISQTQQGSLFEFPYSIDIYQKDGSKKRYDIWVKKQKENTFSFTSSEDPRLIHYDPEHILLAQVKDQKNLEDYIFLYDRSPEYLDRFIAISKAAEVQSIYPKASNLLIKGLNDPYEGIRIFALQMLNFEDLQVQKKALPSVIKCAQNDPKTLVQSWALYHLASLKDKKKYQKLFEKGAQSPSYSVIEASLSALLEIDPRKTYELSKRFQEALDIPANLLEDPFYKGFQWVISKNDLLSTQKLINSLLVSFQKYKDTLPNIKGSILSVLQEILKAKQQLPKEHPQVKTQLDCIKQAISKIKT